MDLELSDEQQALRDTVRRYLAEEAPIADQARAVAAGTGWAPDRVWKGLVELGLTGLLVPADAGGSGASMVDAVVAAEELGRALHPGPWLATAVGAVRALAEVGEPTHDHGELLERIAGTDAVVAVAPPRNSGHPPLEVDDRSRLRGACATAPGLPLAEVLVVPAVDPTGQPVLVAVDAADGAVSRTAAPTIDATIATGRATFDGAAARSLGGLSPGASERIVDDLLVAWGADALGAADAVLGLAVDYAKARHQFGQPIGAFQAVQHLCVDMLETVELARGGVLHAAWAADAGPAAAGSERHRAALRLKAFSDRLATVGDTAIQVFGGIGFTWEHDAHLYLRRLLSWSSAFGPASRYRVALGRAQVGSP